MADTDPPDTPQICEACGGSTEDDCPWCDRGFQSVEQQVAWRRFRRRMQKISSTYSIFRSMFEEMIERLEALGDAEAMRLVEDGRRRLHRWSIAEPATQERLVATQELMAFNGTALDLLTRRARGEVERVVEIEVDEDDPSDGSRGGGDGDGGGS